MTLLALLHRWIGGFAGALLVVIALTGTLLLWESSWIGLPHAGDAPRGDLAAMAAVIERADSTAQPLSRMTFASAEIGLHQAVYRDGSGAYFAQDGTMVARWTSIWQRPELWLFEIHHYLLMGDTGKTVTGILGLLLLAFTVSGLILWWRVRRKFALSVLPRTGSRAAIIRHHRDIGALASPLLLLIALTGSLMIFKPMSSALLAALPADNAAPAAAIVRPAATPASTPAPGRWAAMLDRAAAAVPDGTLRRLQLSDAPDAPVTIRLKQSFEWTPNGRTYVSLDPDTLEILAVKDPRTGGAASWIEEKYYPVHAGKVGGPLYKAALTLAGAALTLLGSLTTFSFWRARARPAHRRSAPPKDAARVPLRQG